MSHEQCRQCGAPLTAGASFCAACGTPASPLAAAETERRIDERVRQVLAEKSAADQQAAEAAQRSERRAAEEAQKREHHATLVASARSAQGELLYHLERSGRPKRTASFAMSALVLMVPMALILALISHAVFQGIQWSPAGVACPMVCEGCRPSAKMISRDWDGSYELLCRNPHVNIDALDWSQLEASRLDLAPYIVDHLVVWLTEILAVAGLALVSATLAITIFFGPRSRWRRRRESATLARLEAAAQRTEAALRAFEGELGDESSKVPYR